MQSRFWKRQERWLSGPAAALWLRWRRLVRPLGLAVLAIAVAVIAGLQLGNSAIADINPVHYRGAVVHPRDRGAAVAEHQPRVRQPTYAALYGWDEGRLAMAAGRHRESAAEPAPVAAPRRHLAAAQSWQEPEPPQDEPVTIHRGKAGPDRDLRRDDRYRGRDYRSRDVYLPRAGDADAEPARGKDEPDGFD